MSEVEVRLWAEFPDADECVATLMDGGTKIGLGVRFGDNRHGIRFDPDRTGFMQAVEQLKSRIAAN